MRSFYGTARFIHQLAARCFGPQVADRFFKPERLLKRHIKRFRPNTQKLEQRLCFAANPLVQYEIGSSEIASDPGIVLVCTEPDFQTSDVVLTLESLPSPDPAPTITDVIVSGSDWTSAVVTAAGSNGVGYSLIGADQLRTLPWVNLDTITVEFSENVQKSDGSDIDLTNISLGGINITDYEASGGLSTMYSDGGGTGPFRLTVSRNSGFFAADQLILTIADTVQDTAGNPLDGEWTNTISLASGDSAAGGDFLFSLNVLPGDVDGSHFVLNPDINLAIDNQFTFAGGLGYDVLVDVDGSGFVVNDDITLVNAEQFVFLPFGSPIPPQPGGSQQSFSVSESALLNSALGAIDPTGSASSFQISGGNLSDTFAVSSSGQLTVADRLGLNHELNPTFVLEVEVTTSFGTEIVEALIDVTDEAEAPTTINDTFYIDSTVANGTVVGNVVAFDEDFGSVPSFALASYSGPSTSSPFAVDASTGQITAQDLSSTSDPVSLPIGAHVLTVEVQDGAQVSTANISVTVNPPGVSHVEFARYDYSISHNDTLRFDPRSQIENQAGRDLEVQVVGTGVGLYGTLAVDQATGGLVYTPIDDVLADPDWTANRQSIQWGSGGSNFAYRYAADESGLAYQLVDPGDPTYNSNPVTVNLRLTNDLPIFLGTQFQEESLTAENSTLTLRLPEGPVGRVDLNEYLFDPDGDPIEVAGIWTINGISPPFVGTTPSFTGEDVSQSYGFSAGLANNLLAASINGTTLELSHEIDPTDTDGLERYPSFAVVFGDGQTTTSGVPIRRGFGVEVVGYTDSAALASDDDLLRTQLAFASPTLFPAGTPSNPGAFPEVEPNDDGTDNGVNTATAQDLASANELASSFSLVSGNDYLATATGNLDPLFGDPDDFYRFPAGPGDSLTVSMRGVTSGGGSLADPLIVVFDDQGNRIALDDDKVLFTDPDALLEDFTGFNYTGDYFVAARTAFPSDFGTYTLELTLTTTNPLGGGDTSGFGFDARAIDTGIQHEVVESFDDALIDLADGSLVLTHDLDFDNSPGEIVPGFGDLIFDSSTLDVRPIVRGAVSIPTGQEVTAATATLRWYDHHEPAPIISAPAPQFNEDLVRVIEHSVPLSVQPNTGGTLEFAVQLPEDLKVSGVYQWDLEVSLTTTNGALELGQSGESVVLVDDTKSLTIDGNDLIGAGGFEIDNRPFFGDGWSLAGIPSLFIDEMGTDIAESTVVVPRFGDRFVLHRPGEMVRTFESFGTEDNYDHIRPLRVGRITDIREFGALEYNSTDDEFLYTAPDHTEYRFEAFTRNTTKLYLATSIQLPTEPEIRINRDTDGSLLNIEMPDGAMTTFAEQDISASQRKVTITQPGGRIVEILMQALGDNERRVTEIRNLDVEMDDDWIRTFMHDIDGNLEKQEWSEGSEGVVRTTSFGSTASGVVQSVTLGDGTDSTTYQIAAALAGSLDTLSSVSTRSGNGNDPAAARNAVASVTLASDLQRYDALNPATPQDIVGDFITEHEIDRFGRLVRRESLFDNTPNDSDTSNAYSRGAEFWTYDRYDSVRTFTAANNREFQYRYDYDILPGSSNVFIATWQGDGSPAQSYDTETDYRGNLLESSDVDLRTRYVYGVDDSRARELGALLVEIDPRGIETRYTRDVSRHVTEIRVIRGADDLQPQTPPDDPEDYVETFFYDAATPYGLIQTYTSPLGLETTYAYLPDGSRRVEKRTVFDSEDLEATSHTRETTFEYDAATGFGEVTKETTRIDDGGAIVYAMEYEYDRAGMLRESQTFDFDTTTLLNQVEYDYRPDRLVEQTVTQIDIANGRERIDTFDYDSQGRLIESIIAAGTASAFAPHAAAFSTRADLGNDEREISQRTTYQYYTTGQVEESTRQDGTTTRNFFDPVDPAASEYADTETNLITWTSIEDVALGSTVGVAVGVVQTEFTESVQKRATDVLGREVSSENLLTGASMSYEYDDRFNLPFRTFDDINVGAIDNPDGRQRTITSEVVYNQIGLVVHEQMADQSAIAYQYDELGYTKRSESVGALRGGIYDYDTDPLGNALRTVETRATLDLDGVAMSQTFTTLNEFDQRSRLVKVVDADGFNRSGTGSTDPSSYSADDIGVATIEYAFDTVNGRSEQTLNGRDKLVSSGTTRLETINRFDGAGRLTESLGPLNGQRMTYEYNQDDTIIREQSFVLGGDSSQNRDTTFVYDDLGRQRQATFNDTTGSGETFSTFTDHFEPDNNPSLSPDIVTTVQLSNSLSHVIVDTYDSVGNSILSYRTDQNAIGGGAPADGPHTLTSYQYDSTNRLVTSTIRSRLGNSGVFSATPDELAKQELFRQIGSTEGALLEVSELKPSAPTSGVNDAELPDTSFELRMRSQVDAVGRPTQRLETEGDEDQGSPAVSRNHRFNYDDHITGTGGVTFQGFDNQDIYRFDYDSAGNTVRISDLEGSVTSLAYDGIDRTTAERVLLDTTPTGGGGNTRTWQYDGLTTSYTDRSGYLIVDTLNPGTNQRTVNVSGSTAHGQAYAYGATYDLNADGTLQSVSDTTSVGGVVHSTSVRGYEYDAQGRVIAVEQSPLMNLPGGGSLSAGLSRQEFQYHDNSARAESRFLLGGNLVSTKTYGIDELGRLESIDEAFDAGASSLFATSAPLNRRIDFGYDGADRRETVTRSEGGNTIGATTYGYRLDGRLESITHADNSDVTLAAVSFTYDANGRIQTKTHNRDLTRSTGGTVPLQLVEPNAYRQETFTYDRDDQLTGVAIREGASAAQANTLFADNYAYDLAGNRVADVDFNGADTFQTGQDNRLTDDDRWTYTYDGQGRLATRASNVNSTSQTFTYDHRGLLLRIESTGDDDFTAVYGYDSEGRLTGEHITESGTVTRSETTHHDGINRLAEFDSAGQIARYYTSGPNPNELLAVDQNGETAWAFHDQLGSVISWGSYDGTEWTLQHQQFDSFGNLIGESIDIAALGDLPAIWAGHQLDRATGLTHAQARWYDPSIGRFISQDPMGFAAGDANLYRYVSNNPVNAVDPLGLAERMSGSYKVKGTDHHLVPVRLWELFGFDRSAKEVFDAATEGTDYVHRGAGHGYAKGYTARVEALLNSELSKYISDHGTAGKLSIPDQVAFAESFVQTVKSSDDPFIKKFNLLAKTETQATILKWYNETGKRIPFTRITNSTRSVIKGIATISSGSKIGQLASKLKNVPGAKTGLAIVVFATVYNNQRAQGMSPAEAATIAGAESVWPIPVVGPEMAADASRQLGRAISRAREIGDGELTVQEIAQLEHRVLRDIANRKRIERLLLDNPDGVIWGNGVKIPLKKFER